MRCFRRQAGRAHHADRGDDHYVDLDLDHNEHDHDDSPAHHDDGRTYDDRTASSSAHYGR